MARSKDKNDQELEQHNLDKGDVPKVELNQGLGDYVKTDTPIDMPIHETEDRADADFRQGNDEFDKGVIDQGDGTIANTEMHEGYDHEQYNKLDRDQLETISEPTADGVIFPGNENFDINNDQKIALDKSDVSKVELNQGLGKYVKDGEPGQMEIVHLEDDAIQVSGDTAGDNLRSDHIGALKVSDDMVDMNTHMDDAAAHQASSEGPPQDPQGMGLDRLGTQFEEDGMGDMPDLPPPTDDSEV